MSALTDASTLVLICLLLTLSADAVAPQTADILPPGALTKQISPGMASPRASTPI